MLIFDDYGNVYLNKKGNYYRLPGGSTEKDVEDINQVANEAKEEARILIKDIKYTGITYTKEYSEDYLKKCWFKNKQVKID